MPKMNPMSVEEVEDRKRDPKDENKVKHNGVVKTRGQMIAALAKVKQQEIIDAEDTRIEYEIWDRTTAINGVSASRVLATRNDIPTTGNVYLVRNADTGKVIQFQPFKQRVGGHQSMTNVEAISLGEDHRSEIANGYAVGKIMKALNVELDSA